MKNRFELESIGFYTLSNSRVASLSNTSPLSRCELILTNACNFKCPYCRGLASEISQTMPFEDALATVRLWTSQNLRNIRFSGGEPTLYPRLEELVRFARDNGVQRIALSTNGSADQAVYDRLLDAGVNDFSISLDACCSATGDMMAGGLTGIWDRVVENIRYLSTKTYVTVGVVVTNETLPQLAETIRFAGSLGVSDIRIISAAQFNRVLDVALEIPEEIYVRYPILRYRINNILQKRNVRGIQATDSTRCALVLDDMAVAGKYHFPCIIYLREQGEPIGVVDAAVRDARQRWFETHDTHADPICRQNCLDVCIDFNNVYEQLHSTN